jgi:hypothetical protein
MDQQWQTVNLPEGQPFRNGGGRYRTSKGFQAGTPRRLFTAPALAAASWALSPDDKRFLFITTPNGGRTAPFTVVLNWAAALKE